MTSLEEAVATRFPAVWVSTQDSHRVINKIVRLSSQRVFRVDAFDGLSEYINDMWRIVLLPGPDGLAPVHHPQHALNHVYENKGALIMEFAEAYAEDYVAPISGLVGKFRDAVEKDDITVSSASVYMISPGDGPPPIFGRNFLVVHDTFPENQEVASIYNSFRNRSSNALGDEENARRLVGSTVGLSESEILTASLQLMRSKGFIDAAEMNSMRTALLKSGANIDLLRPETSFDELGGMDLAKELIRATANSFKHGAPDDPVINKFLLIGVPGCGKSAFCKATAHELGLDLARTGVSQQMSKWIGQSEQNMRHTLAAIFAMRPVCVWIDELGRDFSGGGTSNDGGTTDRVHGEFLTGLQEMPRDVFLIAAANRIDGLAPEMLRAGRFDKILFIGFPAETERSQIFNIYLDNDHEIDIETVTSASEGFTGSEIEQAVKEFHFSVKNNLATYDTEALLNVIGEQRNLIIVRHNGAIMDMYRRATYEWNWASSAQRADAEKILNGDFGPLAKMKVNAGVNAYQQDTTPAIQEKVVNG